MRRMYSLNQLQEIALKKIESTSDLKVFENIVDKDGHKRFDEGEAEVNTSLPSGVNITYKKWALSGNHLMLVCAGDIASGTTVNNISFAFYELPKWVYDKIYPVWGSIYIESKPIKAVADNFSTQDFDFILYKVADSTKLTIRTTSNVTLSANRGFRVAFDLLIDDE